MRRALPLLAVSAALVLPASAHAGPPGEWTRVTPTGQLLKNISEIAIDRTPGGGLHLLWSHETSVFYDQLQPNLESLGGLRTVTTYGGGVNTEVDVEAVGPAVFAYYAGLQSDAPHDGVLAMSQSTDGGGTWTPPAPISDTSPRSTVYAAGGLSAVHGLDGQLYSLWASPGSAFHVGASPADPDTPLPGESSVDTGIGVDPQNGDVVAAWNLLDEGGTAVMHLRPMGSRFVIPGSDAEQTQAPLSVVGRIGGGIYVGYSAGDNQFLARPGVFRVGAGSGTVLSSKRGARHTSLTRTASGRLWAFWHRDDRIYARRSNEAATRWGGVQSLKPPRGTETIWGIVGDGLLEPLDLVARIGKSSDDIGGWHQRLLPRLTLRTKVSGGKVTVTVLDVGDPVSGATVTVKGAGKKKTSSSGKATFSVDDGKRRATASAPYGGKGAKRFRVR